MVVPEVGQIAACARVRTGHHPATLDTRMDMQLRLLKRVVTMLAALAATLHVPAMASPSEPEARQVFASEVGHLGAIDLKTQAMPAIVPSGGQSSKVGLIDEAIAELFAGDLTLRSGAPGVRHRRVFTGLSETRQPADWRSQDAWGTFLIEAQQQAAAGRRDVSVDAVELQTVSTPETRAAAAPPKGVRPTYVLPVQLDTSQPTVQLAATQPDNPQQHAEAVVRVSASSVEVRAIEMIAPVGRRVGAAGQPRQGVDVGLSGQITGNIFVDRDGDGQPGRGDVRLEAQPVSLTPLQGPLVPVEHRTAAFGQFGFDALEPGSYLLTVSIGWDEISVPVEIEPGKWSQRVDIAVPSNLAAPASGSLAAQNSLRSTG